MFKKVLLMLILFVSNYSFSQFHHFYFRGTKKEMLKYHDKCYDVNPRGLQQFVRETEMSEELKTDLNNQIRKITSKSTISKIFVYAGFTVGGAILLNEVLTSKNEDTYDKPTIFRGMGVVASGIIIGEIIRPRNKDYKKFINTFNEKQQGDKVKFSLKVDYDKQMRYGLVMSF